MGLLGIIALFLGLVAVTIAENKCPTLKIDSLCTCDPEPSYVGNGAFVVCRGIRDPAVLLEEIQTFRGYKISSLFLLDANLPYLPAGLFLGMSVRRFIINDSVLDNLYSKTEYTPSPFSGLEDSLEEFQVLYTTSPSTWYYPDLKGMKRLKKVAFVHSPIDFVGHVFAEIGEGSLESITFMYSNVYRIHPQAFPQLTNLKEVYFKGNLIPYMVRTMFPEPATQLKRIDLSENKLFTLPENMFDNMPALEYLDLSKNEFKTFQMFPAYNDLTFFFISQNPFECGCHLLPLKQITASYKRGDMRNVICTQPGSNKKKYLKELSSKDLNCY